MAARRPSGSARRSTTWSARISFLEVGNVVWRKVRASEIAESDGRAMVAAILEAPFHVEPAAALLPPAWEIAVRHDRSVYDGVYLALAVALDAPLITADHRLSRALRGSELAERVVDVEDLPRDYRPSGHE